MAKLADIMVKARRAVLRQGVLAQDADELVHDAFLRVEQYERDHQIRSREALMVRTATNLSIDRQRRGGRAPLVDVPDLHQVADAAPDPARIVEARERLRHATEGLARLPERTRRILLRRRLDNLSYAEIAAEEEMTVAAVEKLIARATLQLMSWMSQ